MLCKNFTTFLAMAKKPNTEITIQNICVTVTSYIK